MAVWRASPEQVQLFGNERPDVLLFYAISRYLFGNRKAEEGEAYVTPLFLNFIDDDEETFF